MDYRKSGASSLCEQIDVGLLDELIRRDTKFGHKLPGNGPPFADALLRMQHDLQFHKLAEPFDLVQMHACLADETECPPFADLRSIARSP